MYIISIGKKLSSLLVTATSFSLFSFTQASTAEMPKDNNISQNNETTTNTLITLVLGGAALIYSSYIRYKIRQELDIQTENHQRQITLMNAAITISETLSRRALEAQRQQMQEYLVAEQLSGAFLASVAFIDGTEHGKQQLLAQQQQRAARLRTDGPYCGFLNGNWTTIADALTGRRELLLKYREYSPNLLRLAAVATEVTKEDIWREVSNIRKITETDRKGLVEDLSYINRCIIDGSFKSYNPRFRAGQPVSDNQTAKAVYNSLSSWILENSSQELAHRELAPDNAHLRRRVRSVSVPRVNCR